MDWCNKGRAIKKTVITPSFMGDISYSLTREIDSILEYR